MKNRNYSVSEKAIETYEKVKTILQAPVPPVPMSIRDGLLLAVVVAIVGTYMWFLLITA